MAFTLGKVIPMPLSAEGVYLLPYAWFKYGQAVGALKITSPKFWDTIQGSMIAFIDETHRKMKKVSPFEFFCYVGDGVICPCHPADLMALEFLQVDSSEHLKIPITHRPWFDVYANGTIYEKKTLSHSLIQLFAGCHITLEYSVWEVSYTNYSKVLHEAIIERKS